MPTFYVDKTGSDSTGDGSPVNPWLTILHALVGRVAGDTVYVRPGVYAESLFDAIPTGNASLPFTLSKDPAYAGTVTLLPSSGIRVISLGTGISYVTISGLVLDATNVTTDCVKITNAAHHITIADCELKNSPTAHGILINNTHDNLIQRCSIHDNGSTDLDHQLYIQSPNIIVEDCHLYNGFGYGIHQFDGDPANNIYRRNLIHGLVGIGILLTRGITVEVSYNVIYDTGIAVQVSTGETGSLIYNNTCAANDGGIHLENRVTPISGTQVKNNICWGNLNFDFRNNESTTHALLSNLFGVFQPITENMVGNLTGVDPLFRDAVGLNFRLQSGSQAINYGQSLGLTLDYDGRSVPVGAAPDAGAFEFGPPTPPSNLRIVN